MSVYQYYEFQALDRRLTEDDMNELRKSSSRARITPTSFVNEYHYGGFKGNENGWMERYFDAFLYVANWGTRKLQIRLPETLLSEEAADPYGAGDAACFRERGGDLIFTFLYEKEGGGGWEEGDGMLGGILPIRDELARGDLRALYLGWLLGLEQGELDDDEQEPPVPPGLGNLSPAQESFAEFLRIDDDLLDAAAEASARLEDAQPERSKMTAWVAALPEAEKNDLLVRSMEGAPHVGVELCARFAAKRASDAGHRPSPRRMVGELRLEAEARAEERRQAAARREAAEKARREKKAALAREKHLDSLEGKEGELRDEVHSLIATRLPKNYDQAIEHLKDLRDLAGRHGGEKSFAGLIAALREAHARKPSFLERLEALDGNVGDLVESTRRIMGEATAFDGQQRGRNFGYDWNAYKNLADNLKRLLAAGKLVEVMQLAVELMSEGSLQMEASDEGLMLRELEICLLVAIEAVADSGLPAEDVVLWGNRMKDADRVQFICEDALAELQSRFKPT